MRRLLIPAFVVCCCAASWAAATDGPFFPRPFLIEHQVVMVEPGGSVFAAPPVTDHYGGSWIVSVRPDDSRTIVDLARREFIEVDTPRGTYSVLTFGRWAELVRRLRAVEGRSVSKGAAGADGEPVRYEAATFTDSALERKAAQKSVTEGPRPHGSAAIRRVRVQVAGKQSEGPVLEAWADPRIQVPAAGRDALAELDDSLRGGDVDPMVPNRGAMLSAARDAADGAMVIRTLAPAVMDRDLDEAGLVEDVALRVDPTVSFPLELVEIPEGFRRVPHALELSVAWAEEDAEIRRRMTDVSE
jgi:hypothetical protein